MRVTEQLLQVVHYNVQPNHALNNKNVEICTFRGHKIHRSPLDSSAQ